MQNKLDKNYRNLLIVQHLISWLIVYGVFGLPFIGAILTSGAHDGIAVTLAIFLVVIGLVLLGVAVAIAFWIATWWYRNYTYELTDTVFKKRFGILTKRETGIPYERIQNIDVVSPLLYRIFGLSKLNIQTAGGSSYAVGMNGAEGTLPGMSRQGAIDLQQELLRRAHSSAAQQAVVKATAGAGL